MNERERKQQLYERAKERQPYADPYLARAWFKAVTYLLNDSNTGWRLADPVMPKEVA